MVYKNRKKTKEALERRLREPAAKFGQDCRKS